MGSIGQTIPEFTSQKPNFPKFSVGLKLPIKHLIIQCWTELVSFSIQTSVSSIHIHTTLLFGHSVQDRFGALEFNLTNHQSPTPSPTSDQFCRRTEHRALFIVICHKD